jgi:uncharacterized membrane protein
MLRMVFVALVFLMLVSFAVALFIAVVAFLTLACAVAIPIYFLSRRWTRRHGLAARSVTPVERLQNLFAEGRIDLGEFERRVARILTLEH